jgi:hypothetical protein
MWKLNCPPGGSTPTVIHFVFKSAYWMIQFPFWLSDAFFLFFFLFPPASPCTAVALVEGAAVSGTEVSSRARLLGMAASATDMSAIGVSLAAELPMLLVISAGSAAIGGFGITTTGSERTARYVRRVSNAKSSV